MSQPSSHPVNDRVLHAMQVSKRGCDELLPEADWLTKLARSEATGVPLRIKLGLDPTAPDIHLGHTVVLQKLREFQDLGHVVVLIVGDYTARLSDALAVLGVPVGVLTRSREGVPSRRVLGESRVPVRGTVEAWDARVWPLVAHTLRRLGPRPRHP